MDTERMEKTVQWSGQQKVEKQQNSDERAKDFASGRRKFVPAETCPFGNSRGGSGRRTEQQQRFDARC